MGDRVVLAVCDHDDIGGRAAARAASSSLPDGLTLLVATGTDLAAASWHHRVTSDGRTATRLGLPGGTTLETDDVAAVLFRPLALPAPPGLWRAPGPERSYAAAELTALVVSWLASLGPRVVNDVEGASPCGPTWVASRWHRAARAAGLAAGDGAGVRSLLVAGRRVLGARDDAEAAASLALAADAGCRLLELALTPSGSVCRVDVRPTLADPAHVAGVADLLVELASTDVVAPA
jgi:hypothetical protein